MKNLFFVNKRLDKSFLLAFYMTVFRWCVECIFTILLQIRQQSNFVPTSKHRYAKRCRFLPFVAEMSTSETVPKRNVILTPILKQWRAKDNPCYRSQSKRTKNAIYWFGKFEIIIYCHVTCQSYFVDQKSQLNVNTFYHDLALWCQHYWVHHFRVWTF